MLPVFTPALAIKPRETNGFKQYSVQWGQMVTMVTKTVGIDVKPK
jgi:hypothetical protein